MAYTPLVIPTMSSSNPNFQDTANWLSSAAYKVNESAQSFLTDLVDLGAIDFAQVGDLPAFDSVVWTASTAGIGATPTRPVLQVTNMQGLLDRLAQLTPPEAPDADFTYTDPGYASVLRDPLMQKLLVDLVSGGYGIETTDEEALWQRAREREAAGMNAAVSEALRVSASTGFPLPQGAQQKAVARAQQEYADKISSLNRDIALKRSELYLQSRQFTIEKVLASEQQSIALYNAIQDRAMRIAQLQVELAIGLFNAGVTLFRSQQEAIIAQVDTPLRYNQQLLAAYNSDVQAYSALVNAVVQEAQVQIANSRNKLDRDVASHRSRTDIVRFRLQQLATTVEKNRDIYKYGVDYFRTALGAAMSNINGLAVQTGEV
jgi:hypothetical protein